MLTSGSKPSDGETSAPAGMVSQRVASPGSKILALVIPSLNISNSIVRKISGIDCLKMFSSLF
jgi:hypothetical protein